MVRRIRPKKENELLDKQVAAVTSKLPKEKKRIVIMHATASAVTVEGSPQHCRLCKRYLGL